MRPTNPPPPEFPALHDRSRSARRYPARSPRPRSTPRRPYAEAEKALATRQARDFAAWCALRGATALPAHQGIVAAYLSRLADSGRKASTIGRRAAAIGHEPPTSSEGVKAVLRGIRRTIGAAKQGKAPATADLIGQMLALCPDSMIGRRDRALLALGFAGAFRRSGAVCAGRRRSHRGPGRAAGAGPAQQRRPGRAGAGGSDSPRLPSAAGGGSPDLDRSGQDHVRAAIPSSGARRTGLGRPARQ
jgi:hypothetical protein